MQKLLNALLLSMAMLFASSAMAAIETYQFATPEMADRFEDLTAELRCPKCQNQNLSDSDSIISKDLRRQVKTMVDAGKSDDEIRTFMVQRYGDFILYDPPFKMETLVLWLAPGVLVVIGLIVVVKVRRKKPVAPVALSDEEQVQLDKLIKQKKENP
jgi:cytochrome c-type biogenesis protein CcmH